MAGKGWQYGQEKVPKGLHRILGPRRPRIAAAASPGRPAAAPLGRRLLLELQMAALSTAGIKWHQIKGHRRVRTASRVLWREGGGRGIAAGSGQRSGQAQIRGLGLQHRLP